MSFVDAPHHVERNTPTCESAYPFVDARRALVIHSFDGVGAIPEELEQQALEVYSS